MHQLLYDHIHAKTDISVGSTATGLRRLYNESKFSRFSRIVVKADDLDRLIFPERSHAAPINTLSLETSSRRYMLSGCGDSSIKLWDLNQVPSSSDKIRQKGRFSPIHTINPKKAHQFGVTHIRWWPTDSGMFLSSSYDHTVKVFDTSSMEEVHSFDLESRVVNFDITPDGSNSLVACCCGGGNGGVKLVDLRTLAGSHILGGGGKLNGGIGYTLSCVFSPTNPNILVSGGADGTCIGWDIRRSNGILFKLDMNLSLSNYKSHSYQPVDNMKAHNGGVNSIMFNDTGTELITAGNDDKIKVWNLTTHNKPLNKLINFGPLVRNRNMMHLSMCLTPLIESEIQYLWVPSDNGEIQVYNVGDGRLTTRLRKGGDNRPQGTTSSRHRATTILYRGGGSGEFYSASLDGSITTWGSVPINYETTEELEFDNGIDYNSHGNEGDPPNDRDILERINDEIEAQKLLKQMK